MVTVTYPTGVSDFTSVVAAYPLTGSAVAVGSIEFGTSTMPYGQGHSSSVVLVVDVVKNNSTTLVISYELSHDAGVTWFACDECNFAATIPTGTNSFRFNLAPFTRGAGAMRIKLSTGTVGTVAGTVTIRARLAGAYRAYL